MVSVVTAPHNGGMTVSPTDDAAKRISNEMTMHAVAGAYGWAAFRLSDGTPMDHVAYPTQAEAAKATGHNSKLYVIGPIQPDGYSPSEAAALLEYGRLGHDSGAHLVTLSREIEFDPTMPYRPIDRRKKIAHLATGGRLFPKGY